MWNYNIWLYWLTACLLLSSCATIFNSRHTTVRVETNKKCSIVLNNDTVVSNKYVFNVQRSRKSIELAIIHDSVRLHKTIKAKNSLAFWGNLGLGSFYGPLIGFVIDWKNPKRYTYPRNIYVNIDNRTIAQRMSYVPPPMSVKSKNIVKWTPLKLIDLSNAGVELSLERKLANKVSIQASAMILENLIFRNLYNTMYEHGGFKLGLESKYYVHDVFPFGMYISAEASYLNRKMNQVLNFSHTVNDSIQFTYPDSVRTQKQTFSLVLKLGFQYVRKRLVLDMYVGVGLRYRNVKHYNKIYKDDLELDDRLYYCSNCAYKGLSFHIPFNVRVGLLF